MTVHTTSHSLVLSWRDGSLVADNYRTLQTSEVNTHTLLVLAACAEGAKPDQLASSLREAGIDVDEAALAAVLPALVDAGLLESGDGGAPADPIHADPTWRDWGTEAQYFHFATKDAPYIAAVEDEHGYVAGILRSAQPALFKAVPGSAPHPAAAYPVAPP